MLVGLVALCARLVGPPSLVVVGLVALCARLVGLPSLVLVVLTVLVVRVCVGLLAYCWPILCREYSCVDFDYTGACRAFQCRCPLSCSGRVAQAFEVVALAKACSLHCSSFATQF